MSDRSVIGLASIIVPCWNQVVFTRQCVAALRQHTRDPWELIVIDNGSTDGTGHYLAGVRDMSSVPVTVISNATNLGFPAAINQGLRSARGISGAAQQRRCRCGRLARSACRAGERQGGSGG